MNNKLVVAIVILLSVGVFAWLVDYGWAHRYGSPETYELRGSPVLAVDYRSEQLDLNSDVTCDKVWQDLRGIEVDLHHQVTERPWPKGSTPSIKVQAFHNGRDIYFRLVWDDDAANSKLSIDDFSDSCAVAVPIDSSAPARSIMMGFSSPVNIWHWKASKDAQYWDKQSDVPNTAADYYYPFEKEELLSAVAPELASAVTDLVADRVGSLTPKDVQMVQGRGSWSDGRWTVVMKRPLTTDNVQRDCQFAEGRRRASFAVWDGDQQDRGSRKSISEWVDLNISVPQASAAGTSAIDIDRSAPAQDGPTGILDRLNRLQFLAAAYGSAAAVKTPIGEPRVIDIVAKRFEYVPNKITVKKGDVITLRMESLDVTHGLYIDGYGVDIKARPGLIGKATFVADKPGRFTFRCSETCGEFHPYMVGFMQVTPNNRFHLFVAGMGIAFVIILIMALRGPRQGKEPEQRAAAE